MCPAKNVWRHLCSMDINLISYCFLMPSLHVFVFSSDESRKCPTFYASTGLVLLVLDVLMAFFVTIVIVLFKGKTFTFSLLLLQFIMKIMFFTLVKYWLYNQLRTNVVTCQYMLTENTFIYKIPYGWKNIYLERWPG